MPQILRQRILQLSNFPIRIKFFFCKFLPKFFVKSDSSTVLGFWLENDEHLEIDNFTSRNFSIYIEKFGKMTSDLSRFVFFYES